MHVFDWQMVFPLLQQNRELQEDLYDGESDLDKIAKAAKKKVPKIEENKSKKEHINVVFIGHVGKWKNKKVISTYNLFTLINQCFFL